MNYNLLNNIIDGITAPVRFISFITSNWLGLAIGLTLSLLVILVIWIISKQMPNKIICLLLVLIFSIGGLFVFSKLKPTGDSDVHIPTNEEQSEQLDLSVKENWTNTNGGFTINQINNVQKDDEAPRLDDQIITLNVQDYGPYVCFWYEYDSGVYQNAVFLKTEKGLIYDGMLMTTCKYKDRDYNRIGSILTIWGAVVRVYVLDSLTWNIDKTQIPYYYNYNLATISSGSSCKFCTNNLDGSAWNHTNTPEARARIMQEMTSSTGYIATNIGGYFIKFNDVEIIGTKENATKSINTFYNYLYEQIKGIGTSGFKNIDVTSLTCVPIPNELQSNYPISADKKAEYDGAEYYGVYRVNNYVNLSLTQGNKMIDKSKNVDSYIDDNDDSGRLDVDKVDINSADYTNVAIDLNCIDGDISNVDLSNNPVVINFYCKDLNITKTISYTTKNKLNSINKIMLVSSYRWDYEIISNALVFESNKGYFEPIKTSANLVFNYSYYDNYIITDIGLFPIQTIDESLIDLSKNPVKIILTNDKATYQFVFDNNSMLHKSVNKLIELGKYNYTILSDQLIFASVSGEIEVTTTQTSFLFNYAQTIDVGTLLFNVSVNVTNKKGYDVYLSAPTSVVEIVRDNLSTSNQIYYVKLYFFDQSGNIVEIKSHTHSASGACSDNWNFNNLVNGSEYDCQVRFVDSVDDNLTYISDNYHFTYDNTKSYTFNYTAAVK